MLSRLLVPAAALTLAACTTASQSAAPSGPSAAIVPPFSTTAPAAAPSGAPSAQAAPAADRPRPTGPVNLLDVVPAQVAVSSAVVNPRDFPEHLVDGRKETSWQSRTGDLKGWIAFRIPKDARVERIEITAGYDRRKGTIDLFTANHRISRLSITRDGALLREVALDPEVRTPQSIPIDGPGGEYRIQVLATVPGTKAEWKELAVSELRVVGTPGKALRSIDDPLRVVVGDLDAEAPALPTEITPAGTSFRDLAAVCADFVAGADRSNAEALARDPKPDVMPKKAWCREAKLAVPFSPTSAYKSLSAVRVFDGVAEGTTLVVETPRGHSMAPVSWDWDDPRDPGCPSIVRGMFVDEARIDNGYLVIVVGGDRTTYIDPVDDKDSGVRRELVKSVYWGKDTGSGLGFYHHDPQYSPPLGYKVQPRDHRFPLLPWSSLPWKERRGFHIAPDGSLRVQG